MKVLLLAGTSQARRLAGILANDARFDVIASLAGVTREPLDLPVEMRSGGFGGRDAFAQYLKDAAIDIVVDATHPFAEKISRRSAAVTRQAGMPYLQILRPKWEAQEGDQWTFVASESEAPDHIPMGAVVFLATGRQTLHRFENLTGRRLICRQIETSKGAFPFENGCYLIGRPPFSVEQEITLFRELKIDWLVVKNAGGKLSSTKLTAAQQLGIPVLMINRPEQPDCARVVDEQAGFAWLEQQL